ncbi:adenosine deaminase [Streptomonospora sp. S1-112]|uniref:Adenosine deaminase n=1 Tax=Streptomonospora mangrovi TaxID=2883123 RepID=A0A9X3NLR4_9ACTN|nr:adenosine deaminase [Streptomonospora mangrovi]MDA0565787.1 adenosine deaminase [Streptomonospora mangrovi]
MERPISRLPKAHLHLHFTGSMRHPTLVDLAESTGTHLPNALVTDWPPRLRATDERGWFRFQRLYDIARSVLRTPESIHRLVREAAEDDRAAGAGWTEIQVDPSGYAGHFDGLTATLELVLDAVRAAERATGLRMGVMVAANRTRHPMDARALARLAAQFAGRGVVSFGLSNDERRGRALEFEGAFRIARRAGLLSTPHGGELQGPRSVRECLDELAADRVGHGVRAVEDPYLVERIATQGVTLEVCPTSNVGLGVVDRLEQVPLRRLFDAGAPIALGTDDPLLFGPRLAEQYRIAREVFGFTDPELAELARMSIRGSGAPDWLKKELLGGVDAWLAAPPEDAGGTGGCGGADEAGGGGAAPA